MSTDPLCFVKLFNVSPTSWGLQGGVWRKGDRSTSGYRTCGSTLRGARGRVRHRLQKVPRQCRGEYQCGENLLLTELPGLPVACAGRLTSSWSKKCWMCDRTIRSIIPGALYAHTQHRPLGLERGYPTAVHSTLGRGRGALAATFFYAFISS
jgi:hypothetical protein